MFIKIPRKYESRVATIEDRTRFGEGYRIYLKHGWTHLSGDHMTRIDVKHKFMIRAVLSCTTECMCPKCYGMPQW